MVAIVAEEQSQVERMKRPAGGTVEESEGSEQDVASVPDAGRFVRLFAFVDGDRAVPVANKSEGLGV
ncbi:MAG: hypothetical protein DMG07_19315 [Acidobacteria bacterium]|nr:MAG: hypothetical protein DMG07_19315 [Acidobacteriota bacterium]